MSASDGYIRCVHKNVKGGCMTGAAAMNTVTTTMVAIAEDAAAAINVATAANAAA